MYEEWHKKALEEFLEGEFNTFNSYTPDDLEVCENGDVHIRGNLFHYIPKAVTSWEDYQVKEFFNVH